MPNASVAPRPTPPSAPRASKRGSPSEARLTLAPGLDRAVRAGYPWAFSGALAHVEGEPQTGDVVALHAARGDFLGRGFYHATAGVAFRLLTRDPHEGIDAGFFRTRLARALALRERFYAGSLHYRLAYAEADGLPGTLVDRYDGVLTLSTLSAGMDQRKEWLVEALVDLMKPTSIVERNDSPLRLKDGLPEATSVLYGAPPETVEIEEDGVRCGVDVLGGLKTGFFLDQHLNRYVVRRLAAGLRVLDVFCADGGFGLHAAAGGASSIHFMDSSQGALDRARTNAERSGLTATPMTYERADAVPRLGEMVHEGQ
ncbi:MAG TPA: class I SAM-dependent rRNA methyltransferase, partial [Rhodothermales bacterium]|nr:class I SAM-dependent rRNA methyltransferase [Rhodothermales bacterium]